MPYDIILGRDEHSKKLFGKKGVVFLGKGYVKMGNYTSLSNRILMDVARTHAILVAGKRGSGKSYTLGVIAEELSNLPEEVRPNVCSLIFDTMGIYWTMKYQNLKDRDLLREWGLEPRNLPVKIFVPAGHYDSYLERGIPADQPFALDVSEMSAEDWVLTFGLEMVNPVATLISRVITRLAGGGKFTIKDILREVGKDTSSNPETKNAARSLFEAANTWGVFAKDEKEITNVDDLSIGGTTVVLDLSVYNAVGSFNVRALVISLLCRKIFNSRMEARKKEEVEALSRGLNYLSINKKSKPLIWIFIDEAHEFLPLHGKTIATDALVQLLREGRQPGVSLVLATQQPGNIHRDVMTQSDIVISHRVTSQPDLEALNYMMQSYLLAGIKKYMDELPTEKGAAIILDDNSERIYPMRIRPRFTWHGGEAPIAVRGGGLFD